MSPLNLHHPVVLTRRTILVAVATFAMAVLLGITGWYTASQTANSADNHAAKGLALAVKVQNRIIAENSAANRANAVVAHAQCLRGNDGRVLIRQSEVDIVAIIFGAQLPGGSRTPEQQAALDLLRQRINQRAAELLKGTDCDEFAPMPPNPTKAEIASLPQPTPIPPLEPR